MTPNDSSSSSLYGVIMAGGTGTRFWPLSRRSLPKQFLAIGESDKSLIRETFERLLPLTGPDRVLVVANESYRELVRRELPELREENFLGEPKGRNTAPCIGLAAEVVARQDPQASILVCPADHVIRPVAEFERTVRFAMGLLQEDGGRDDPATVTIGIPTGYPATGYGYIERGDSIASDAGLGAFSVAQFKEKPVHEVAEQYHESGNFFWNSGIFLWKAQGAIELVRKYLPDLAEGLQPIVESLGDSGRFREVLAERFGDLPSISIDYGVLERTSWVATVGASFEWDDVGSWGAAAKYLDESGSNRVRGEHVAVDTENCVVVGQKRVIGTVGVENLVIVETDDSLLVCHRDRVEDVKALVDQLQEGGHSKVL